MKSRKVLSIGLVLLAGIVAVSLIFSSCSRNRGGASGGVTTITVWSNDAHNKAEFDDLVEKFNNGVGAQKNIKIDYVVYGADWQTAMSMALETGREPEMFKGVAGMEDHQAAGRLLAWTEIPGIDHILANQAPYHRNMSSMFGGVPYSVVLYGWFSGLHYNKALLQQAGFSAPPATWAEFEQQAIAIARLAPDVYGYAMPLLWNPDYCFWMTEYFYTASVGHMYWNFTEGRFMFEAFTPYFETLARIRNAGAMFPGMESLSDDQQRAHFSNGKIGFIGGAGWNVGVLYEQFPFGGTNTAGGPIDPLGWDYAPMPEQNFAVPVSAGASYYVSAQVKNDRAKLAAMADVIELFCGEQTQMLMFSSGKHIPLRADVAAKAAPAERPQWTSFGQSANRTVTMPSSPTTRLAAEGADYAAVIGQILTGQIPITGIRNALTDLSVRYNAAFDQAVQRGQIKREDYLDPTFEQRLRAR